MSDLKQRFDELRAAGGGAEASLWAMEFRGETTATMVYDAMPVFDHFSGSTTTP